MEGDAKEEHVDKAESEKNEEVVEEKEPVAWEKEVKEEGSAKEDKPVESVPE